MPIKKKHIEKSLQVNNLSIGSMGELSLACLILLAPSLRFVAVFFFPDKDQFFFGPYLSIFALLGGAVILYKVQDRTLPGLPNWLTHLMIIWFLLSTFSSLMSPWVAPALSRQSVYLCYCSLTVLLAAHLYENERTRFQLVFWMAIGLLPFVFYVHWLVLFSGFDANFPWFSSILAFRHTRHFAYYALVAGLLCNIPLIHFHYAKRRLSCCFWFIVTTSYWTLVFWCAGRTSITAGIVGLAIAIAVSAHRQKLILSVYSAVSMILATLWSLLLRVPHPEFGLERYADRMTSRLNDINEFASNRLHLWQSYWDILTESTMFGIGPMGDSFALPDFAIDNYGAHNIFLQFGVDWGVPAMIAFLLLIAALLLSGFKLLRTSQSSVEQTIWFAAFLSLCGGALLDNIFNLELLLPVVLLSGAGLLACVLKAESNSTQSYPLRIAKWMLLVAAVPVILNAVAVIAITATKPETPRSMARSFLHVFPAPLAKPGNQAIYLEWIDGWAPNNSVESELAWLEQYAHFSISKALIHVRQKCLVNDREGAYATITPYAGKSGLQKALAVYTIDLLENGKIDCESQ